jgi:eukaryotic-like serine/threonine-protein kinase
MLGRVLGDRYRVLSRLGEGGMGTVYLCEHAVLHRRFAIKLLRREAAADPELVDRFRNEAISASRIGQENVVEVLDFGAEEDGVLYYVMEALDGRSLGALIREEGPLPVPRALEVLDQICRALGAAHASGVVHRDVKPDNVFLARREDGTQRAKVIDFGISHVPPAAGGERITREGALIGTPEYMAPEQAAGGEVDPRTDVYAVGVLAFEMLTGTLPLEGATPVATLVAHQTCTPDPPSRRAPGVPPEVDALVLRALAKRPEDRFPTMDALAAEVTRVRAALARATPSRPGAETLALPEPPAALRRAAAATPATGPAPQPSRRVARAAAAAALAVGVAIAAVAWWWTGRDGAIARSPGVAAPLSGTAGGPVAAADAFVAPVPAPALVEEDARPAVSPRRIDSAGTPATKPARRAPSAATVGPRLDDLKDPYAGGGLKDPFE